MPNFESGVKGYTLGVALVETHFPIDYKDMQHECCEECFYYREASKTCGLNHRPVLFPGKYVGEECPMHKITEEQYDRIWRLLIEIFEENEGGEEDAQRL